MSKGGSAPSPPDPTETANAQGGLNKETALFNWGLNNSTQNTPLGSISYGIDTSNPNLPRTSSNISLNPQVQSALNSYLGQTKQLSDVTSQYLNNVQGSLSQPYNLNSLGAAPSFDTAYRDQVQQNLSAQLQPYTDRQKSQLDTQLANQGITAGSEAYRNAQDDYNRSTNNLQLQTADNANSEALQFYNQQLASRQQAVQEYTQQYNEPLQQLNALRSGSQVQLPSFNAPAQASAQPGNYQQAAQDAYQGQLSNYNSSQASSNSLTSGLFGLGGNIASGYAGSSAGSAAISALLKSDRRLKKNIKHVGKTPAGIPLYEFEYKSRPGRCIGVMAQELEKIIPAAVITLANGFKAVNYAMVP